MHKLLEDLDRRQFHEAVYRYGESCKSTPVSAATISEAISYYERLVASRRELLHLTSPEESIDLAREIIRLDDQISNLRADLAGEPRRRASDEIVICSPGEKFSAREAREAAIVRACEALGCGCERLAKKIGVDYRSGLRVWACGTDLPKSSKLVKRRKRIELFLSSF